MELHHAPAGMQQQLTFEFGTRNGVQSTRLNRKQLCVFPEGPETEIFDTLMPIPEVSEWISPLLSVVPMQLLSYHIAAHRGLDIDQPRNLAKSVTVE